MYNLLGDTTHIMMASLSDYHVYGDWQYQKGSRCLSHPIVYPIILQAAAGCCGVSVVVPAQHECDGAKILGRSARADGGGVPSMSTDTQPDVHSVQSTAVRAAGRRGMRCGRGDDGAGQRPPPQRCIGRSVG